MDLMTFCFRCLAVELNEYRPGAATTLLATVHRRKTRQLDDALTAYWKEVQFVGVSGVDGFVRFKVVLKAYLPGAPLEEHNVGAQIHNSVF
jgi:hypothetical protein